jgi:hypothetical protein
MQLRDNVSVYIPSYNIVVKTAILPQAGIVAFLPNARTVESRKPRNTHAIIELLAFIARC